jgi:hypothetical protein
MITNTDGKTYNRTDTYENWIKYNPVLGIGEIVVETDTVGTSMKIGDGITTYDKLMYFAGAKTQTCPYAVGDIYCTLSTVKPQDRWKGTTWEELPAGRALVAQGTYVENGETFNFTAGSTGGEAKHQLTIGEIPTHSHDIITGSGSSKLNRRWQADISNISGNTTDDLENAIYRSAGTFSVGGSQEHNNLSPYVSIYIFKRIN